MGTRRLVVLSRNGQRSGGGDTKPAGIIPQWLEEYDLGLWAIHFGLTGTSGIQVGEFVTPKSYIEECGDFSSVYKHKYYYQLHQQIDHDPLGAYVGLVNYPSCWSWLVYLDLFSDPEFGT